MSALCKIHRREDQDVPAVVFRLDAEGKAGAYCQACADGIELSRWWTGPAITEDDYLATPLEMRGV